MGAQAEVAFFPPVRADVSYFRSASPDGDVLAFFDMQHFVPEHFALHPEAANLLSLFNGRTRRTAVAAMDAGTQQGLSHFEALLEANHVLDTPAFRAWQAGFESDWERLPVREPVCAGPVYPADADACRAFFDAVMAGVAPLTGAYGLFFAPHLDYRVGLHAYLQVFRTLQAQAPERVVLLGTSHYAGLYHPLYADTPLIGTLKDFQTPLGVVKTDTEAMKALAEACGPALTLQDRAHRIEHALELHAVLLRYLLGPEVRIVPVLCGSLEELLYMPGGAAGLRIERAAAALADLFAGDGRTVCCVSGDLAHVGRKFGDAKAARSLLPEVERHDRRFMETAAAGRAAPLLALMQETGDAYRICGFPPLFTALQAFGRPGGRVLDYRVWDETERSSAVTVGAMAWPR